MVGEHGSRPSGRKVAVLATLLILAGVANNARSLGWGFQYDDFVHQLVLRHVAISQNLRPWSLYDFGGRGGANNVMVRYGYLPWWTSPDFKVRFFRPVTSLSIWLDYTLYGGWAPGYHITSLILLAVFLALAFKLCRDLGAPSHAALWALAFLAMEGSLCMPAGWIANRNTLLAALFTVAAVLAVHRSRRRERRGYLLLGIVCFLLACGSKESGTIVFPIVALYLYLFDGTAAESRRQALLRVMHSGTLWVFGLLSVGYAAFYLVEGYGTRSGIYSTPWIDPGDYLVRLSALLPLGLSHLFFGFPTDLVLARPDMLLPAIAASVPALAITGVVLLRTIRFTPISVFAIGWTLFSLLPEAGADLFDRLFVGASVGTSLLIGLFLHRLAPLRERLAARQYGRLVLGGLFVLAGIVIAVPGAAVRGFAWNQLASLDRSIAIDADIALPPATPQTVFLLNSPSTMLAWSLQPIWIVAHGDLTARIFPLQFGRRPMTWTCQDDRTMTLSSETSPFLAEHFERLFIGHFSPPSVGMRYETAEFTAVAVAVEPDGIRTIRFEFKRPLDDPAYRFLAWQDGRMARIVPPAVGRSVHVPEVPRLLPYAP